MNVHQDNEATSRKLSRRTAIVAGLSMATMSAGSLLTKPEVANAKSSQVLPDIWSGWEHLGGTIIEEPAVSSWAANRLDVFTRNTNSTLGHKSWNGSSWSGWESLGG